jgi:hypothetical protein
MVIFNHALPTESFMRHLGVWLWLTCLVVSSTVVVVLDAPQIFDQYTSGRE